MSLGLPLSARSGNFFFSEGGKGCVFAVVFCSLSSEASLDFIAHDSIIRVFTVFEDASV